MDFKNLIIGIAIMILTISVVVYGVHTFYPKPEYSDFCSDVGRYPYPVEGKNDVVCPTVCVEMWEISNKECVFNECGSGCGPDGLNSFETLAQCEVALSGKNCWTIYDEAMQNHSRNVFMIALPIGILIIALGALVFGLETVGAGVMAGGLGVVFWGVSGFWRFADEWIKFILSLIGLIVLILLAYYVNKKFHLGFFRKKKKRR